MTAISIYGGDFGSCESAYFSLSKMFLPKQSKIVPMSELRSWEFAPTADCRFGPSGELERAHAACKEQHLALILRFAGGRALLGVMTHKAFHDLRALAPHCAPAHPQAA